MMSVSRLHPALIYQRCGAQHTPRSHYAFWGQALLLENTHLFWTYTPSDRYHPFGFPEACLV